MADLRANNEFVLVNENTTNNVLIHREMSARIETLQKVDVQIDYSLFLVADMPTLPGVGEWVESNTMYTDGTLNWNCIQSHNMTSSPPIDTPALFRQYRAQCQEWIQPIDQYDSYMIGDTILFNSLSYKSIIDYNVYSPTGYPAGWELLTDNPCNG